MRKSLVTIFLTFILLTGCSSFEENSKKEEVLKKEANEELISELITYSWDSEYIDYEFLNYISLNYGIGSLKKLKEEYLKNTYSISSWHSITGNSLNVLYDLFKNNYQDKENIKIINEKKDNIIINYVGDISLADNWHIMPYYDSRNEGIYGILSEELVEIMNKADIMIANNEFTFSNRGTPLANKVYTFRANPDRVKIYHEMGVDLVTIANNHAYDYGKEAFFDTLDTLDNSNIARVGGGKNIDEAKQPYYYIINGYKIAFLAATRAEKNIITPEATNTSSGVMRCYDPTMLIDEIRKQKEVSDFVILLLHWGKESSHELESVIKETGKMYIDSGADLIVGSHAHVLQGMEYYNGKLIAYNLGNFIFNKETIDTGILRMNLSYDGELSYEFIPCLQSDYRTILLSDSEKNRVINDMNNMSINLIIDKEGNIKKE